MCSESDKTSKTNKASKSDFWKEIAQDDADEILKLRAKCNKTVRVDASKELCTTFNCKQCKD